MEHKYYICTGHDSEDDYWVRFFNVGSIYSYKQHNGIDLVLKEHFQEAYHVVPKDCFNPIKPLGYYMNEPIFECDVDKFLDWFIVNVKEPANKEVEKAIDTFEEAKKIINE